VLRGNLAPRGAIIKPSAATPALMTHRGRAVVFENSDDFHKRIDDESLDVDETCILVLKNCGPKGYPGMAEVGNMPLPPKVLRKGITDMVRISDARMSGTAYGTVVLHTAPEAAAGGPLAAVRNGDFIELDVPKRRLHLDISDAELAKAHGRLEAARAAAARAATGSSTSTTYCRPTRAPTSTSWWVAAARSCPKTTTDTRNRRKRSPAPGPREEPLQR
jgi:dihydroxy-acid dehydratase